MSNYTKTTNFAAKDSLPSGNAGKIVKGTEIDAEFNNIATASATKADINDATLTGTTTFGSLNDGTITITGWVDEDNMSSNSAVLVPTQQSVKAYVDSTTTAQDLDVTDGTTSIDIDLDSESLGILGGTGVTSTASGTGVTLAIDSTVATLTGTQTLTNKTLTTPTILTSFTIGSATISEAELEILDGATVTTAELNVLDGITSTTAELNILDGVTSTAAEINILDGVTSTTAELNILDGVTSSATELNILDGVTSTTAELNILDGVTSTAAELNILDGVTSTTAELNILDGVTSTATELNLLDGVTATTAELNYTDGVTSAIQTQLDSKISGADAALTGNATITTSDNTTQLALISTDADANAGPILDLFRNSVSAADNDLTGQVYFSGKNDADEKTYYGQITSQITDVSNGSEDFKLELSTLTAGSSNSRLLVTPTETVFNEQSADLDFRIESDGNTNAFFLEGSSGSVGIGTSSPASLLHLSSTAPVLSFTDTNSFTDANDRFIVRASTDRGAIQWYDDSASTTTELMTFLPSGSVGIGTSSPSNDLHIASSAPVIRLEDTNNNSYGQILYNTAAGGLVLRSDENAATGTSGSQIIFETDGSQKAKIDSSGNLLVGKTASSVSTDGVELTSTGFTRATVNGDTVLQLNRRTSDGTIIDFRKDGSTVGRIGALSGGVYIGDSDVGLQLDGAANAVRPCNTNTPALSDNFIDLGSASERFKNLYLSGFVRAGAGTAADPVLTGSDGNTGLFFPSGGVTCFTQNGVERGRFDASGHFLLGRTAVPVGVLSGRQLVSSSTTGAEIIAYRDDNAVSSGDFVGAHLIGNDDNSGTPDHFCGMWATASSATGAMNLKFASQLGGYESGTYDMRISSSGSVSIAGALSKGSGSFRIDHPLPAKTETHDLVHSFVEAPQADNIYRGKVDLVGGSATVNIDTVAGMTEGTYVLLNTNTQCFTSNESGWTAVKGSVSGNTLTITAQESCTDTISWMVVGERKDQHMIDTDWTDDNGKVIVEPLKENN